MSDVSSIDEVFDIYPRLLRPVWGLFSGGYDSLVACDVASQHPRFAGVVHINTGIGVDETREYVRDTCRALGWPLREYTPPPERDYTWLVRKFGTPGPGFHSYPYRYLKERQLEALTRDLKEGQNRLTNVCLVSGVRKDESQRRTLTAERISKTAGRVFVSSIFGWSKADVLDYRDRRGLPRSEVVDTIHKSGECLCGAFAAPGELEELAVFWPRAAASIRIAEDVARAAGKHATWGTRPSTIPPSQLALWDEESVPGVLCAGCA